MPGSPTKPTASSPNLFQEMLELIEELSGVRTVIYDRARFTERAGRRQIDASFHGHRSGFCQSLRVTKEGDQACIACDVTECTAEAARRRAPFLHTCHAGLTEVAFPVMYRGEHVATVFCGQVAIADCPAADANWLARRAKQLGASSKIVRRQYAALPRVSKQKLLKIGTMLFNALNYLAESEGRAGLERTLSLHRHPPVRAALAFADEHFGKTVSLKEAADHCSVAPEHLSRLFHRIAGETFSAYLTRRRIQHAKELLTSTTLDMSSVAEQCGYAHQSYFGRKFKQATGVSPLRYRAEHARPPDQKSAK